ncbi:hypothetical protein V3C99_001227, partial [Haemonchus contortus]
MTTPTCSQQNVPLLHLVNAAAQTNPRFTVPMLMPPNNGMPRWPSAPAPPVIHNTPEPPIFLPQMYNSQLQPRLQYPPTID